MYRIISTTRYKKDLLRVLKRGYNPDLMDLVVSKLADGEPLELKYCDHELKGEYTGYRECHITPDWLLIYQITEKELILYLTRTRTHSDLF